MTAFDGARDMDMAEPRPWLVVVRGAIGLVLAMVFAVSLVFLMWVAMWVAMP